MLKPRYYQVDVEARALKTFTVTAQNEDEAEDFACMLMQREHPDAEIYVACPAEQLTKQEVEDYIFNETN